MHIEQHSWHSPRLDRDMAVNVYGHWGQPYIVFPCSRGRYFDYEGMGMVAAIAPFIDSGRIKLFCVDSIDAHSWYDFGVPPAERNSRHEQYDQYITEEVVPFIRSHCNDDRMRIMTNGCSMGAYHAVNFFLRHPDLFAGTIALSGLYRLDRQEFGNNADDLADIYFNSPVSYLPGLSDPWYLNRYRESTIIIGVGQGAWEEAAIEDTRAMDAIFRDKGIGAWVDYWGTDVNHDWPWWYKQMNYFLGRLYG
ncbi:alpha/beta hydrolase-fold protein [uncultured Desulfosarcina sp.]|uniref:esterase family protein n=1 Tax=uncultured Desulfosarcina sp. TaxID=218289 RepID=UPI0029C8ABC6|nr:alpha/beta hydrolase-fold protein [uncultured Desulfosarcina sp.]